MADFKEKVHLKSTFSNQMRMERLLNVVSGDTKASVENIDKSKIFYADELKPLKRDFGDAFLMRFSHKII